MRFFTFFKYIFFLFVLFISQKCFSQKADFITGNVIIVDGKEVCQFVTNKDFIYLHNFSANGVKIYNDQGAEFLAVKKMIRNYFAGKQIQVIAEDQALPSGFVVDLKQFEKSTIPLNKMIVPVTQTKNINSNLQAAGGLFLAAELFPISGQMIVQGNPTESNLRTAQILGYVGSVLRIVGAIVMIGSN